MKEYTVKVFNDGSKSWFINGKLHREECADGYKMWYFNDKLHREGAPAIECADGSKLWYINGKLHREDGPAIEYADGTKEWWMHGKQLLEQEFINCNEPLELTLEQIAKKFNVSVNKLRIKD